LDTRAAPDVGSVQGRQLGIRPFVDRLLIATDSVLGPLGLNGEPVAE
jgi:hypothetical protein